MKKSFLAPGKIEISTSASFKCTRGSVETGAADGVCEVESADDDCDAGAADVDYEVGVVTVVRDRCGVTVADDGCESISAMTANGELLIVGCRRN